MRIETTTEIAAPVSRVWEVTMDVESYPEHTDSMTSVELLDRGPVAVGTKAKIKQPGQPAKVWTVAIVEPESRFAWSTKMMGLTMTGWHLLESSGTGTRNTLAIEITGAMAKILGPLLRSPINKAITAENEGIKAAATG